MLQFIRPSGSVQPNGFVTYVTGFGAGSVQQPRTSQQRAHVIEERLLQPASRSATDSGHLRFVVRRPVIGVGPGWLPGELTDAAQGSPTGSRVRHRAAGPAGEPSGCHHGTGRS